MDFKFSAHQEFQIDAIDAVVRVFAGQPRNSVEPSMLAATVPSIPNRLSLDEATLLENVRAVQIRNGLQESVVLEQLTAIADTAEGVAEFNYPNFSVEMETGTGKTYVYLRTALELFRNYAWRKFIIVVPSVAIREGVLSTLRMTEEHFRSLYNVPYHYFKYDSGQLSQLRQFAVSDAVEIMVMTLDSFNKDSNLVRQATDKLQGETPLHLIQSARPILILDEPQNMESDLSKEALGTLAPLFALRYSATHRNAYCRLYRLSPFDAYRQGLVKRIEVASVVKAGDSGSAFCELLSIESEKRRVRARLNLYVRQADSALKLKTVSVEPGDDLGQRTRNSSYDGISIEEINPAGFVRLSDQREIRRGEAVGADKEAIFEAQLRYTIEEHFRKQERLRSSDIKVLSLFFIDTVENYVPEKALIARLFDEAFDDLKMKYAKWRSFEPRQVRIAYFAQKRRRDGSYSAIESTGKKEEDIAAFNLIMRDKAGLLSFDQPAAFIFSHSALREGWDSPNVFQICTLNQTKSELKKRQEVGRGVRLAVNQNGDRVFDDSINVLTVIANESYEEYVDSLQREIAEEFGEGGMPPRPPDARRRREVKLQKHHLISPAFQELWRRISERTRYKLRLDSARLVADAVTALADIEVGPPRIEVAKGAIRATERDEFVASGITQAKAVAILDAPAPELVSMIAEQLQFSAPAVRVSRRTILDILGADGACERALANPVEYSAAAARCIRDALAKQISSGIVYEKIGEHYEMALFEESWRGWEQYLVRTPNALYDYVMFDSDVEKRFAEDLELRSDVKMYLKLPRWFVVKTPVGSYNPDWALVMEERDEFGQATGRELLYLVRETKSTLERANLRRDEAIKLDCGEKHFSALDVSFKVVTAVDEL